MNFFTTQSEKINVYRLNITKYPKPYFFSALEQIVELLQVYHSALLQEGIK